MVKDTSLTLRTSTPTREFSHVARFHIFSPYRQSAARALARHALCASLHGFFVPACRLPRRPLPLIGRLRAMNPSLVNLEGATRRDQILCCSRKSGC